jgi:hypothetical protein
MNKLASSAQSISEEQERGGIIWDTDWRTLREDRLAHGGVFAWFLKCQTHGRQFQSGCMSCDMAQDHNDDILRELLNKGLIHRAPASTDPLPTDRAKL